MHCHIGLSDISHPALYLKHQNDTSGSTKGMTYKSNPLPNSQTGFHQLPPPAPPGTRTHYPLPATLLT